MPDITKETQELMNVLEKAFQDQCNEYLSDKRVGRLQKEILVLEGDFNIRLIAEHIIKEFGTD